MEDKLIIMIAELIILGLVFLLAVLNMRIFYLTVKEKGKVIDYALAMDRNTREVRDKNEKLVLAIESIKRSLKKKPRTPEVPGEGS